MRFQSEIFRMVFVLVRQFLQSGYAFLKFRDVFFGELKRRTLRRRQEGTHPQEVIVTLHRVYKKCINLVLNYISKGRDIFIYTNFFFVKYAVKEL